MPRRPRRDTGPVISGSQCQSAAGRIFQNQHRTEQCEKSFPEMGNIVHLITVGGWQPVR